MQIAGGETAVAEPIRSFFNISGHKSLKKLLTFRKR